MIEVELFDGTILEFPAGTSQEVISRVAREQTAAIRGARQPETQQQQEQPQEQPRRTLGETLYENIIGRGEADTPGERLGQAIRGGTAALARGMADVPALPANLAQLAAMGFERATGMEQPSAVSRALGALPETREMLASVPVIGPESQYMAPGTMGEYISTAGEFAGGAGLLSGPSAMMRFGVVPGVASEAAGQATEGTAAEPYARVGAALAAPLVAGAAGRAAQKVISPAAGQITPARREAVEALRREGIQPTAGQVVGGRAAEQQLYREAATAAGRQRAETALEDFTAAAMKRIGSTATRATPEALEEATKRIGGVFDDVVKDVSVVPATDDLTRMSRVLETYRQLAPKESAAPIFTNINKELVRSFRSGNEIPASTLKTWRSTLSKLTTSPDAGMREAAIEAVDVVDEIINSGLMKAGKPEAIQRLGEARNQYRNLLAIERAAARSDIEGVIQPLALRTALLSQGRRRYVQGRGDLAEMTRAASDVLRPLPQSGTQPRLGARELLSGAPSGGAVGLGAVGMGLDPATATVLGAATAVAPALRNQFLSSAAGQRYFQNQLLGEFGPIADRRLLGLAPGLLAQ